MNTKERFLKYIKYDTQSNPYSKTHPSSTNQFKLANLLKDELLELGVTNAYCDEYSYVYGYIPSSLKTDKTIGLIAHMDTSFDASGKNIKPTIIKNYEGSAINLSNGLSISPNEFPSLKSKIGHEIIVTDGTTLLGADDKAGIAIIMTIVEMIKNKEIINFPNLVITFTPDEEIGEGTDNFNYQYYKDHSCNLAYTLDGGDIDSINYENFNAADLIVDIKGKSIHPGSAKGKMINSQLVAMEYNSLLPSNQLPSLTEGREGFFHLSHMEGFVSETKLEYIIRHHDIIEFNKQKEIALSAADYINKKYGYNIIDISITDSYFNMKELILENANVLNWAIEGLKRNNITPKFVPIRGGTDGARLSFEGIYTPNLGTGGENFHGPLEYLDVTDMEKMVQILKSILEIIME